MKLTREQKTEVARQLANTLKGASQLYFTQFQGLKFVELAELRKKLKPTKSRYRVIKNSVVDHALQGAGISGIADGTLHGPVGLVVGEGTDPVAAAKVLAAFAKDFPLLKLKAGYIDGSWLSGADCIRLSTLGTRPELLSMLAGTLHNTIAQAAGVLQAPLRDFVLTLKALQEKKGSEAPAAAA